MSPTRGSRLGRAVVHTVLAVAGVLCLLPLWILLMDATRSGAELHQGFALLPSTHLSENLALLGSGMNRLRHGFFNSLFVAGTTTALATWVCALAAFGLSQYRFPLRKTLLAVVLLLIAVPPQLGIVGFYRYLLDLRLLNNYLPLILPAVAAPITVYFLVQYLRSILHPDLLDAARIDGCGELTIFHRIILPLCGPGLATMAIFGFVGTWNQFLLPFLVLSDRSLYTLAMEVQFYGTGSGVSYAALALCLLPLLVFYLFLSKYILAGVTLGGLKE